MRINVEENLGVQSEVAEQKRIISHLNFEIEKFELRHVVLVVEKFGSLGIQIRPAGALCLV